MHQPINAYSVMGLKQGQGWWVGHLGETLVAYFPFFGGVELKLWVILNLVFLFVYFHVQTTTKIVVKTVGTMTQCWLFKNKPYNHKNQSWKVFKLFLLF